MRIAIATVQVPFQTGGATLLCNELSAALIRAGHSVGVVTAPFRFGPDSQIERAMDYWKSEDFRSINYISLDIVIPLSFPCWGLQHPQKRVWMLHQHRAAYELYSGSQMSAATQRRIHQFDTEQVADCAAVYTISQRVSNRLKEFNALSSRPLLHPPPNASALYRPQREALPFIFFPSRIESLKRQTLAIEAMRYVDPKISLVIAGMGGQYAACLELVRELGLEARVRLLGEVSETDKRSLYALATAVLYPPYDEDYGYITLEAMCAAKPVITCLDSGGVLQFVVDGETGIVAEPSAHAVANAINELARNPRRAVVLGEAGWLHYQTLNLSWDAVVATLAQPITQ